MKNRQSRKLLAYRLALLLALLIPVPQAYAELAGDLDYDGYIGPNDLKTLAEHWLLNNHPGCQGDIDNDCDVDFYDYTYLADNWRIRYCSDVNATTSSTEGPAYLPSYAVDETWSTRWSSAFADNQWLQLDLGRIRNVGGLEIFWEAAYADEYSVELSLDANDWTPVYSDYSADGKYDLVLFSQQSARYIRINCITRATPWGNSIWEVFVITDDDCTPTSEWTLIWSDEFGGTDVNTDNWEFQIGNGCPDLCWWGNNELQYYTSRPINVRISDGNLIIQANEESYAGHDYTSARLRTYNKKEFIYGKFEARIKVPRGQGMWPTFWLMPTDFAYGGWAASGEVDMMETRNIPTEIHGVIHFGGEWPFNTWTDGTYSPGGVDFSDDFHVYTFEWEPTQMRWYVDGNLYRTENSWWSSGGPYPAPFDQRFHILLNIAVGGNYPGPPDGTTVFPQQMVVDYVRVYHKNILP